LNNKIEDYCDLINTHYYEASVRNPMREKDIFFTISHVLMYGYNNIYGKISSVNYNRIYLLYPTSYQKTFH